MPSPPFSRRGGGRGDGNPRVPPPTLTCPGPRQRPGPPRARPPGRRPRRLAGGWRAGGRAPRRLGRAAGRRASCRAREQRRGPDPQLSRPGCRACAAHTLTLPGRVEARAALTCEAPEPQTQNGGRGRHATRGSQTHEIHPQSPGPWALTPAPHPQHTPRNLRRLRQRYGSAPHPTHTHSLWVLRQPPRRPGSQLAHPHAHLSLSHLISPGTRSSSQHSRFYWEAQKHSTSFSSSGPEGATAAISPRQGKQTHTQTRARAHQAPTDASPPKPRPQTQTQTPTGGPHSRPPRREAAATGRARTWLAGGWASKGDWAWGRGGPLPPPHLHSARRGPGGDGGGGGGAAAAGAGAAAAGEAAAAVAAGLRAAKTCRQPAGGRGTGRRGRGAGGPGRAAGGTAEAAAKKTAADRSEETDWGRGGGRRAAPPVSGTVTLGTQERPRGRGRRREGPPPEEAAPPQPLKPRQLLRERRRAWPWPWPPGAGAVAAAGVAAAPAAAGPEAAAQRR